MKKILFMLINMNVGGTEKALLTMLSELDKSKYDVTILMLEKYGGFLHFIPDKVHIEYVQYYENMKDLLNIPPHKSALGLLVKGKFIRAFSVMAIHFICKFMKDRTLFFRLILKDYPIIDIDYDIAVAYAGPMDFITYYVLNKVKAKKKIQWIHFDVTKIGLNQRFASRMFDRFDKIFVVSTAGKNKLINLLPNLKDKTQEFFNIISSDFVTKMANDGIGFQDSFNGIRILTVGRLSKEKGQDLTIPVLFRLKQEGYKVRWYCVGDGNARNDYEKCIKESDLINDYILLGANPNPYPFMKHCDIYVQSSRHEGYCITLAEARCFSNPIVSTNFTGASEQIIHGQTGLIVECNEEQIYHAIKRLMDEEELRNKLRRNLQRESVDTTKEIEKLYKIADDIA